MPDDDRPIGFVSIDSLEDRVDPAAATPIDAVGRPDMQLRDALSLMLSQTGSHLVVVDAEGRLAGLVSADLISAVLAGTEEPARAPEVRT